MQRERRLLALSGLVALAAGGYQAARGLEATPGRRAAGDRWLTDVDSELRFYATWYAATGALALHLARRGPSVGASRAMGAAWLAAGIARTHGAYQVGRPSPLYQALGASELVLGSMLLRTRRTSS